MKKEKLMAESAPPETKPEVEAHAAETLPPAHSEDAGLTDAELSAKRGLSHRDGPADAKGAREIIADVARKAREAAAAAKGAKAR